MNRRAAIQMIGVGAVGVAVSLSKSDHYEPVGYLEGGMPLAPLVTSVTLDGVEQFPSKVLSGDDREGWIEVMPRNAKGFYLDPKNPNRLYREIRRGVVRFTFKKATV